MPRVPAVAAVLAWINAHPTLSGPGKPLDLGAFRARPRSPGHGAYVLLFRLDGSGALTAEEPADQARIAGVVYAGTDDKAEVAAVAYANALEALSGAHVAMGDAICLVADDIVGPQFIDEHAGNGEQFAYQVDADFFLINGGS